MSAPVFAPRVGFAARSFHLLGLAFAALIFTVTLAGPNAASARTLVDDELVRQAVLRAWEDHGPAGSELEIRVLPKLLAADSGSFEVVVELPDDLLAPGPRVLGVACQADGRSLSRGLASVLVRTPLDVLVTPEALPKGSELNLSLLDRETRSFDREPRQRFFPVPGARYRVVRDLAADQVVQGNDVRRLPDVEPGTPLRLVSTSGAARVQVEGVCRRAAFIGDIVLVENPVTGGLVRARLLSSHSAELIQIPRAFAGAGSPR